MIIIIMMMKKKQLLFYLICHEVIPITALIDQGEFDQPN